MKVEMDAEVATRLLGLAEDRIEGLEALDVHSGHRRRERDEVALGRDRQMLDRARKDVYRQIAGKVKQEGGQ